MKLYEVNLEFSVVEISGPPKDPDHSHYVGDRNKIAKSLKAILNYIRKKYHGDFQRFRKIKVYGIQVYSKFIIWTELNKLFMIDHTTHISRLQTILFMYTACRFLFLEYITLSKSLYLNVRRIRSLRLKCYQISYQIYGKCV